MMKRTLLVISTGLLLASSVWGRSPKKPAQRDPRPPTPVVPMQPRTKKPQVQIAILLDTSNSMDGLIDQAKIQLWSIVNEFIYARRNHCAPEIEVALYEYGNDSLPAGRGHIRRVLPFTTDLDHVSEVLFGLNTDGGREYCGWAIQEALMDLNWDRNDRTLKTLFIAGNEPFTQGNVDYRISCRAALQKGVLVNTIHCGTEHDGREGQWHHGASLARGHYLNINHNQAIVHIPAPQDDEIAILNTRLNETYMAYGQQGRKHQQMQMEQDGNAARLHAEAEVQRIVAKSSSNYRNGHWDLVDAAKEEGFQIESLEAEQLPEELRSLSPEERRRHVEAKAQERARIQSRIQILSQERRAYVARELQQRQAQDQSLGSAVIQAVREQAKQKGFVFVESE